MLPNELPADSHGRESVAVDVVHEPLLDKVFVLSRVMKSLVSAGSVLAASAGSVLAASAGSVLLRRL